MSFILYNSIIINFQTYRSLYEVSLILSLYLALDEVPHLDLGFVEDDVFVVLQVWHLVHVGRSSDDIPVHRLEIGVGRQLACIQEQRLGRVESTLARREVGTRLVEVLDAVVAWLLEAHAVYGVAEVRRRPLELVWREGFVHVAEGDLGEDDIHRLGAARARFDGIALK